ncbi:MAG TPA: molybdopterin-dependent oxidoreductase [Actinomycetota bacterium]|nr:molybdopterin-dependent oxidoreductase [Actinomycetota bacterium]
MRRPAGRHTNLALLAMLSAALLTGFLAYGVGTAWGRWIVVAHGVAGLAIVALAPWKSVIVQRGVARRRPGFAASIALTALAAVAILTGILHATGLGVSVGPVTSLQVHVGAALAAIPLAVWHVLARPVRPRRTDLTRRNLLRAGTLLGGAALTYAAAEGLVRVTGLPGGERRFTGSYDAGSLKADALPVTQWLDDSVQRIDPLDWRLTLVTMAEVRELSYEEVGAFGDRIRAILDCTGGWYSKQDWEGVRLDRLIPEPGEARSVVVRSVTGYSRRLPVRDLSNLLLAVRLGGEPLPAGNGFPARLVAPGRRGFWWVKWVSHIETSAAPWWLQSPFPLT